MKKLGILHISDIHINKSSCSIINEILEKLVKDINKVKKEYNINIDLICFTGDLIASGAQAIEGEKQLTLAEEHFIAPLIKALNLSNDRFILVPGNHEVNKNCIIKMTEKGLSNISSKEEIDDIIINMEDEYKNRLAYFYDYIFEKYLMNAKKWNLGYSIDYEINGIKIGIAGIDSSWRSSGIGYQERGKLLVGEKQVTFLYENIKNSDIKICLMHHPLDWLSNLEMSYVERKINNFDLVLCGHIHDLEDKQISTQKYRTIYNTSGKLNPVDDYYSGYSLIDINIDTNKCNIFSREYYNSPREDFDKALRINKDGRVEYSLMINDDEKKIEADLKLQLEDFFKKTTEKHEMFRNIDNFSPSKVNDFFVEPTLYEKSQISAEKIFKGDEERTPVQLDTIINNKENIILVGKSETGKTTLLQQFGIKNLNSESNYIPVYIDMFNTPKTDNKFFIATLNFLNENISQETSLSKEQIKNLLDKGKFIYLIDNFDISNSVYVRWIKNFTENYPKNRFIFATEEKFYQKYSIKDFPNIGIDFKILYLDYFTKNQVREMITKWGEGKEELDINSMTQKIVTYCNNIQFSMTPFNIAVFMTIWDVDRNFIPINEGKVMETYLETVLDKLSSKDFQRSSFAFNLKQDFLGYLAYEMYKKNEFFFKKDEFDELVNKYHEHYGFKKDESKFNLIFFEKNILYKNAENIFFSNTSILEYCLAFYATKNLESYKILISKENRILLARELAFYSGITNDCTELLNLINSDIHNILTSNLELLDEIETIDIGIELKIDKENFEKAIIENRKSMKEIDDLENLAVKSEEKTPMEINKINIKDKSESFLDLLSIYGNIIKNAETLSKEDKKNHLKSYILGMNFQFSLIIKEFSGYLSANNKEELPNEIREKYPNLTNEEYIKIKNNVIDLLKLFLPIAMQCHIAQNIGTPKLELVIEELICDSENKKFTKFMLSFLYCDLGNIKNNKEYFNKYIKNEKSKNILKLIFFKLNFYYRMRYFGTDTKIDNIILDLITEVYLKLHNYENVYAGKKGSFKQKIKKQLEIGRI